MNKLFFIFLVLFTSLWAEDPIIDVINKDIALPKIIVKDKSNLSDENLKRNFYNILVNDLKVSSNFEIVNNGNESTNYIFEYSLSKNTNNLDLNVKIKIGNIEKSNKNYSSSIEQYPFLAHKSVKDSVNALGLAPVDWMDHKILISRTNSSKKSQIIMADYTLTYQKIIIEGGLNLFPKWGNKEQTLFYYTAYDSDMPTLYSYNLKNNRATKILSSEGMVVASDVSTDGSKLLVTMAPKDQPDIYLYDLNNKKLEKLTNYSGIDVNGNFIGNDDSKIVYVSDRLGYPNIFIQTLGSNIAEQVVFHGKNNSSVSTYKDFLVYSSREPNQFGVFNIYLMSIKSDYIRQLTANGKNLFPRFSSDGGSVVFIKYLGSQSALGVIRVNANKAFYFPLKLGKIQSIDW
ncbi:Tol-Pal system protein TolB [Campylobacter novaezeelandiae]|uniref:Tol-Pal system protein TolB n=1 Tax=Campylobacter novaezeelandiae TaxID=2267891 RepID=A0A4Q9JVB0_9BACT|nr:Tol-Pal system protein TolB [Campylobacter novaezeelandiae]QWU79461.1 Tol-Pal system translocation protein TolB [Campylobacter novaezeelandiae]TBR78154.1 Tol-Pal system protein TolB [Campylobacter novaezeelandiae]TBR79256.1 Tol-Pal system protein TolB [Campylobacter novaezeelandiae]TBR80239.1 Tol-Pal system protein TolB [Campylobacter novaezeelandiae]TBR81983.1 Tol-Pal system protein TolB [Campylobacter novaezeelandiae]